MATSHYFYTHTFYIAQQKGLRLKAHQMNYCYAKQNKNSHCFVNSQFFENVVATVTVGIRCKVQCATAAATASIQIFTFFYIYNGK